MEENSNLLSEKVSNGGRKQQDKRRGGGSESKDSAGIFQDALSRSASPYQNGERGLAIAI